VHFKYLKFLGNLMGYAICSGNLLNINLHPVVWKLLVGQKIYLSEYESVDIYFFKQITDLINTHLLNKDCVEPLTQITFQFSDGKEIVLEIEKDNSKERLIERAKLTRLNEFKEQMEIMKQGLREVVPENILQFLTWRELEELVSGKNIVNLDLLKRFTHYYVKFVINYF
jgi:hypothetical protein